MKYKPYKGTYPLTTKYRYSSGALHAAWDIGMPTGTPLYSPMDGIVLDCHDGVHNNKPGEPIWSGKPSNWVLLGFIINGQKFGFYSQHMSPGLKVRKGQHVHGGQLIGYSGNSGNSTGPHWHNSAQKSWSLDRYLYLNNPAMQVYPPNQLWGDKQPGAPIEVPQKFPGRRAVTKAMRTGTAPWVSKVKRALKKRGYEVTINDKYDKELRTALIKFKTRHSLGSTGRLGKKAWLKLGITRTI